MCLGLAEESVPAFTSSFKVSSVSGGMPAPSSEMMNTISSPSGQPVEQDTAFFFFLHHDAVEEGIFHNGLEGELGDCVLTEFFRHIHHKGHAIVIAHVLETDIKAYMLQLLLNGVHQLPAAQGQFIKTGQGLDGFGYFLALPGLGQPVNHIQGIIEKMRINLGLQCAEFRHPKLIRSLFWLSIKVMISSVM